MCGLHLFILILWCRNEGLEKDLLESRSHIAEQFREYIVDLVSLVQTGFGYLLTQLTKCHRLWVVIWRIKWVFPPALLKGVGGWVDRGIKTLESRAGSPGAIGALWKPHLCPWEMLRP